MPEQRPSTPLTDAVHRVGAPGRQLRYARVGQGRPLVLLHTLRTQLEYFQPLVERLDLSKFDVIAPDLPGHGESDAPPARYDAGHFADRVAALLEALEVKDALVVGESIGATIALMLAARQTPRIGSVVALNPYDYGQWGGIRRSSGLANLLFTAMLWPGVGFVVARTGTRGILRRVMGGGLHDPAKLPEALVADLYRCGALPGHASAFRSLCLNWRSWIAARDSYPQVRTPLTLVYADGDWSLPEDREANRKLFPQARRHDLDHCGHFSCLERPEDIARIISDVVA